MTKYLDRIDYHRAHCDAWDGTTVVSESNPCSSSYHPDYSKSAYDQPAGVGDPVERDYEPYSSFKTKSAPSHGVDSHFWYRALHGDWVRLTPYHNSEITTENFLVCCPYIGNPVRRLCSRLRSYRDPEPSGACYTACSSKLEQMDWARWQYQGDLAFWQEKINSSEVYQINEISSAEIQQASLEVQQQAVNESYMDYDALTELFEMKETSQFFMSNSRAIRKLFGKFIGGFPSSDVRAFAGVTPKILSSALSRAARKVGAAWMAYRYAVMPLVYSAKDILKVMDKSRIVTSRASRNIQPTSTGVSPPSSGSYITLETEGEVTTRAAVIAKYSSKKIAQMQSIALNPLSTAWELLPYSFVFDWFLNVGDYITNNFSASFATDVGCCKSLRVQKRVHHKLHHELSQTLTFLWDGTASTKCWPTNTGSKYEYNNQTLDAILRTVTYNTYHRWIFSRGSSSLSSYLNPTFNWKRICDSMVLTHNQFRSLRRFFH